MAKETPEKKPRGRPPAGAVLVDGRWQPTEQSIQMAAARLLQDRENRRARHREMRKLLRHSHPELFARGEDPKQTKLKEARSTEQNGNLTQYQRNCISSNFGASDNFDASLLWRPQQRDGIPSLPRGPASL